MLVNPLNYESNPPERTLQDQETQQLEEGIISFESKVPAALKEAMNNFIELYPNWDQYRLIKAALAGFLVQNGVSSRPITRLYIGNMFPSNSLIES